MIANFGGGTTEISVVASGGMVLNKLVKTGGMTFDLGIASLVRHTHDFLIGRLTAETLRRRFGIFGGDSKASISVAGRNLVSGVPKQQEISISLVRAAMKEPLEQCIREINSMLDRTPPEVLAAIRENGIYLTGGVANMPGLARYIEGMTGYRVQTARRPDVCSVEGLSRVILSKELKKMAYSMLDDNIRWMK